MNKNIELNIPFFSQIQQEESTISDWERKICWLACLKMCIDYLKGTSPSLEELLWYKDQTLTWLSLRDWKEKKYPYYIAWTWWFQYWLVMIAKNYWLHWVISNTKPEKSIEIFKNLLEDNVPIIASVSLWFEKKEKNWWHLVVLAWIKEQEDWNVFLKINDPMQNESIEIYWDTFLNSFSWNYIVIDKEDNELYKANNPIYISEKWEEDDIIFIHLHWDEIPSRAITEKYIELNGWKLYSLNQNYERFIRYSIDDINWKRICLRIDPNRIFDENWLEETIRQRNSHLNEDMIGLAIEKWRYIREYILSKIDNQNWCVIWVHNNRFMTIWKLLDSWLKVKINPEEPNNAFILTNDERLFDILSTYKINLALDDTTWDWSLSAYLKTANRPCLTIESWYEDPKAFRKLLDIAVKVITKKAA